MDKKSCLRCDGKMEFQRELVLKTDNTVKNLMQAAFAPPHFKADLFICSKCGKMEFYKI